MQVNTKTKLPMLIKKLMKNYTDENDADENDADEIRFLNNT